MEYLPRTLAIETRLMHYRALSPRSSLSRRHFSMCLKSSEPRFSLHLVRYFALEWGPFAERPEEAPTMLIHMPPSATATER